MLGSSEVVAVDESIMIGGTEVGSWTCESRDFVCSLLVRVEGGIEAR